MNLADIIARHARATPSALAVQEGARSWTYGEFEAAVARLTGHLRRAGVGRGEVTCVCLPTGALHLAMVYALARIGAVLLEVSEREFASKGRRLAGRFSARHLIAGAGVAPMEGVQRLEPRPAWMDAGDQAGEAIPAAGGDDGWRIALTSGSTGEPKAVLLSHAMQWAFCESNQGAIPGCPEDRYLSVLALDFDAGLRHCIFLHWAGAAVLFEPPIRTAEDLFDAVARTRTNYLSLTPTHLHTLLAACQGDRHRLPGLRVLRSGGMVHSRDLVAAVRARLSPNFFVMYGTNDGGSPLTCAPVAVQDRHPGSIGMPCPGVEVGIADESGVALGPDISGFVRVRSPGIPRGYVDSPEETRLRFRDDWYYTGDRGRLSADGALFFEGRADDLMNFDGIKIYPYEIESTLLGHPAVIEAAAFPVHVEERQDVPVAAVTLRAKATEDELLAHCRRLLGPHAPVSVLAMRSLPRTAIGKIDKRALAAGIQEKMTRG